MTPISDWEPVDFALAASLAILLSIVFEKGISALFRWHDRRRSRR